jgi:roadblock/LC7 domain-containing protein
MTIKIAVAGRTNTGKTTFITTLMRMTVGKIDDSANVTTEGQFHVYDGLQATFIDTPGFQDPSLALMHLEDIPLTEKYLQKLIFDLEAIECIKKSDIAIFLGSLSAVPDDSYKSEIDVVKKIQPKVVAVLNQYHKNFQSGGKEYVENRIRQWTEVLNQKGIDNVIIFDAHWDKRAKEKEIYDALEKNIDDSQKADFYLGLTKFKERQNEIRGYVCGALARTCENLQKIKVCVKIGEYNDDKALIKYLKEKVEKLVEEEISYFVAYVEKLYEVAAEQPKDSLKNWQPKDNKKISIPGRLGTATGVSAFIGTMGAALGGIVGAVGAGLLSGGLGAGAGAVLGAQIGGIAGTGLGSFAIFSNSEDSSCVTIESKTIEDIIKECLAIAWGLEHNGFGRGKSLSTDEAKEMKSQIGALFAKQKIDDWTKVNQGKVMNYCKNTLQELENNY